MIEVYLFILFIIQVNTGPTEKIEPQTPKIQTRRILRGDDAGDTRPYMVYLQPAVTLLKDKPNWLCGGVIIDDRHVLTSAACISDLTNFYVISGTSKLIDPTKPSDCYKYGAKRAIWKCVPGDYMYSGEYFDNIRWLSNDIAIVQVEDPFNFHRLIKGCDYVPVKIAYNNVSVKLESAGTLGYIAGWGSTESYLTEDTAVTKSAQMRAVTETSNNSPKLLETGIVLLSKKNCKKVWPSVYHYIIDKHMICARDDRLITRSNCIDTPEMHCKELEYSDEDIESSTDKPASGKEDITRRLIRGFQENDTRRAGPVSGGFCENDHGGPLIVGHGKSAVVVGVISASITEGIEKKCRGPFLFTSVWNSRLFIKCALTKDNGEPCNLLLRTQNEPKITVYNWGNVKSYVETVTEAGPTTTTSTDAL